VNFPEDERGVSELIGFILIFGFVIILMSVWQAQVVPAANSETEFKHYTEVQEDLSELRSDYIDAAETGTTRSTTITLGTTYPARIFFANGPPPHGQIYTEMPSNGTITASGFDVSQVCGLSSPVRTRSIAVNTDYNHLSDSDAPPYRYENTVLYRQTPDGTVIFESDQTLVQGSTLNLHPLTSNISKSGAGAVAIDFMGAETGEIEVSDSVSVTLPTTLSDEQWEEVLRDEPNFDSVQQVGPQRVKIVLSDASWKVQCGALGTEQTPDVSVPNPGSVVGNATGVFRIGWQDPSGQSGTESPCDSDDCAWNVSSDTDDVLDLTGATTPLIDGMGVHFATSNTSVATVTSPDSTTDSNGTASIDLKAQANGTASVYVATGGTSDVINITVTGADQNSNNTAASRVEYINGSGSAARAGPESRVDFDIRNTGSSDAQITGIKIESSDGSLESIREDRGGSDQPGQHEIYIDSSTAGIYEASGDISPGQDPGTNAYQLGTKVSLTQNGTLGSGQTAQVTLFEFRNPGRQEVSAADKPLTVTIYFQDDSAVTFTFTPPGY